MESKEIKAQFLQLKTRTEVAGILGIDERSLRFFLFKVRPENMYVRFRIAKRGGGFREICAPNRKLKAIQRKLADILEIVYREKACAYGFVRGKNIVQNARNHTKSELVLSVDVLSDPENIESLTQFAPQIFGITEWGQDCNSGRKWKVLF